jgi:hypothetical protein
MVLVPVRPAFQSFEKEPAACRSVFHNELDFGPMPSTLQKQPHRRPILHRSA